MPTSSTGRLTARWSVPARGATFGVALVLAAGTLTINSPEALAAVTTSGSSTSGPQCRGESVDPSARIRYRSDILIKAPLSRIFKIQTDVERWPTWQAPVLSMKRLDPGQLRKGSRFRWTTPAPATATTPATTLHITSTVRRLKHNTCILWAGPAVGKGVRIDRGVHLWTFTKVKGGVRVHTEETWTGAQVQADIPTATKILGMGLEAWLHDLKTTAETSTTQDSHHGSRQ